MSKAIHFLYLNQYQKLTHQSNNNTKPTEVCILCIIKGTTSEKRRSAGRQSASAAICLKISECTLQLLLLLRDSSPCFNAPTKSNTSVC